MDVLGELEEVFHRLLVDRTARDRLRSGDLAGLGEATRRSLSTVDLDELERLATGIRRGMLRGDLGGMGLLATFPETMAAIGNDPDTVVERFLADAPLDGIDGIGRRAGISVVEVFHDWASTVLSSEAGRRVAQHELAAAVLRLLTVTPSPGFRVRSLLIRRTSRGWLAVLDAERALGSADDRPEKPVVFVSQGGRYATGAVSHRVAAILLADDPAPPAWARDLFGTLAPTALETVRQHLAARGLR